MNEVELVLAVLGIAAVWHVWRRVEKVVSVLDGVVDAQSNFAPVVERMGEMLEHVWESQETRKQVLADHERQATEHNAMLQKLDAIKDRQ